MATPDPHPVDLPYNPQTFETLTDTSIEIHLPNPSTIQRLLFPHRPTCTLTLKHPTTNTVVLVGHYHKGSAPLITHNMRLLTYTRRLKIYRAPRKPRNPSKDGKDGEDLVATLSPSSA